MKGLKDFTQSGHSPTLLVSFVYFSVSVMVWVLFGALGVYVAKDFGLTASQQGFLVAIPMLGGALVRVPMGILVDRIGAKKTGVVGQLIVLVPLVAAWRWGASLPAMAAFGLLLGAAGGSFAVALPLASRWYPPRHQGLAMGIVGAGNGGTVLAALLAPRLAEGVGWREVFGWALVPVALTLALFTLLAKESPAPPAPRPLRAYFKIWRERDFLGFCVLYGFTFGGFVGLASFLLIYFHDRYGASMVTAGNLTAVCALLPSLLRPVGGYVADRFGGVPALRLLLVGAAVGLAGVAGAGSLAAAVAVLGATMGLLGMGNGAIFQMVPQRFGDRIGAATGGIGAAGGIGGFLLPSALGVLRETTGNYASGFLALAVAGLGCLGLLLLLHGRWKSEPTAEELTLAD
jgi:NNP family nitrate/nitrite transporter-like MFS transporter